MSSLDQPYLDEIKLTEEKLVRNWVFWEEEGDNLLRSDQRKIREQCDALVKGITQYDEKNSLCKEHILFIGKFYLDDTSLAPWTSRESRNHSAKVIDQLMATTSVTKECENIIVEKLQSALEEVKKAGLSNEVNNSGYRKSATLKIGGKLIGASYTKMLDKMEKFKSIHVTELGYLHILIQKTDLEKNWRFILPLLLTFLDDTDVLVKREAAILLDSLCKRIITSGHAKSNILLKSQTMPLFKTAIQPLLLALPSLTPEAKSVKILFLAYQTIFDLFLVSITEKLEYYNAMGAVLNDTILPSIGKCKDYAQVLLELGRVLREFLQRCGEFAQVLTKQIVYTLLTVLMDPYIIYAPDVVLSLLTIVQESLQNLLPERRQKFKYDVLGCTGTLERRLQNRGYSDANIETQVENLVNCFDS